MAIVSQRNETNTAINSGACLARYGCVLDNKVGKFKWQDAADKQSTN